MRLPSSVLRMRMACTEKRDMFGAILVKLKGQLCGEVEAGFLLWTANSGDDGGFGVYLEAIWQSCGIAASPNQEWCCQ